ncbi:MAG TPA: RNA 2',3'-cyclic phosphodiesterase [Candidatus Hydrogenedentes bacterium]|nr:RNA 2',3'-cyclic phosphodiesterase [Candidatus Hydrogenedentota bacterium]
MRAFIAITLPEEVKESLAGLSSRLQTSRAKATWVRPERMHLTLRFLGDVSERQVEQLIARLAPAYEGRAPFELAVAGVGVFPNVRKPSVVWAGITPLEGGLAQTQHIAEEAATGIGLPPETRPFHPHLTLARIRHPHRLGTLAEWLAREAKFSGHAFVVSAVSLFSSELTRKGPIYQQLGEFRF